MFKKIFRKSQDWLNEPAALQDNAKPKIDNPKVAPQLTVVSPITSLSSEATSQSKSSISTQSTVSPIKRKTAVTVQSSGEDSQASSAQSHQKVVKPGGKYNAVKSDTSTFSSQVSKELTDSPTGSISAKPSDSKVSKAKNKKASAKGNSKPKVTSPLSEATPISEVSASSPVGKNIKGAKLDVKTKVDSVQQSPLSASSIASQQTQGSNTTEESEWKVVRSRKEEKAVRKASKVKSAASSTQNSPIRKHMEEAFPTKKTVRQSDVKVAMSKATTETSANSSKLTSSTEKTSPTTASQTSTSPVKGLPRKNIKQPQKSTGIQKQKLERVQEWANQTQLANDDEDQPLFDLQKPLKPPGSYQQQFQPQRSDSTPSGVMSARDDVTPFDSISNGPERKVAPVVAVPVMQPVQQAYAQPMYYPQNFTGQVVYPQQQQQIQQQFQYAQAYASQQPLQQYQQYQQYPQYAMTPDQVMQQQYQEQVRQYQYQQQLMAQQQMQQMSVNQQQRGRKEVPSWLQQEQPKIGAEGTLMATVKQGRQQVKATHNLVANIQYDPMKKGTPTIRDYQQYPQVQGQYQEQRPVLMTPTQRAMMQQQPQVNNDDDDRPLGQY